MNSTQVRILPQNVSRVRLAILTAAGLVVAVLGVRAFTEAIDAPDVVDQVTIVNDTDYGYPKAAVEGAGGRLVRDAATTRFNEALAPLQVPRFDALPVLRAGQPGGNVFFEQTVHLTPRGHQIVAQALGDFIVRNGL